MRSRCAGGTSPREEYEDRETDLRLCWSLSVVSAAACVRADGQTARQSGGKQSRN